MNLLDIQIESTSKKIPTREQFKLWIDAALKQDDPVSEVVIRIVDEDEMTEFNRRYRDKKGATNILSFAYDETKETGSQLLGDLLVCAPVVEKEAIQQDKRLEHHWAHMIVHGVLHLRGYDHVNDADAKQMENFEIEILNTININNPYQEKTKK